MIQILGWASYVILLLTLVKQVHKQSRDGTTEGVSKWLFVGQLAASLGFLVYSYLVGNMVFVVTNGLLTLNNIAGIAIYYLFRDNAK